MRINLAQGKEYDGQEARGRGYTENEVDIYFLLEIGLISDIQPHHKKVMIFDLHHKKVVIFGK